MGQMQDLSQCSVEMGTDKCCQNAIHVSLCRFLLGSCLVELYRTGDIREIQAYKPNHAGHVKYQPCYSAALTSSSEIWMERKQDLGAGGLYGMTTKIIVQHSAL